MKYRLIPHSSFLIFLLSCCSVFGQGNLIDSSTWVENQPADQIVGFSQIGYTIYNENRLENVVGPFGTIATAWKVVPYTSGAFRGFETNPNFTDADIDVQSDYRFSVWVKLINGNGGRPIALLRGTSGTDFLDAAGNPVKDPYFNWSGTLATGDWYLMVGFVKGMNSTNDYENERGFYLQGGTTREFPLSGPAPHRFNTSAPSFSLVCQFNNAGGTSENMVFYNPRLEKVNGAPDIQDLLSTPPVSSSGEWSSNSNGIHYNSGNVGIGTADPGTDWKLAVNGKIRSKEIKVETGWADYVFEDNYPLPTLQEVQEHITEKGHLMNIPSAAEVEANGIELGEMNRLLLEKIEELTLYLIEQDKAVKAQQLELLQLRTELKTMKKQCKTH